MLKTFTWNMNGEEKLVSEDGYIHVYPRGDVWMMDDRLEGEVLEFKTKEECLDEGASRMMITMMGEFNVFLKVLEKGDLRFKHVVS